jgi:DNA-binding LytR/AlgR family response regulator
MAADFIFIPIGKIFKKIPFVTLLYIHKTAGGTRWVTAAGTYTTSVSLEKIERSLPVFEFCRVSQSCLVSLSRIISFDDKRVQLPGLSITMDKIYARALKRRVRIIASTASPRLAINGNGDLVYK